MITADALYYKGYINSTHNRAIIIVYEELQEELFESFIGACMDLGDGSSKRFSTLTELNEYASGTREISKDEYDYLANLSRLQTEIFLNQYTGGFPREGTCLKRAHDVQKEITNILNIQLNRE